MRSLRSSTPFRYPAGVCSIDVLTILEVGVGDALERGDFVGSTALDREVLQVQELFHGLIRSRAKEGSLSIPRRLPKLALSMARETEPRWYPVPGMYGGFKYSLTIRGESVCVVTESWCRVADGSGQRHRILATEIQLLERGFV